MRSVIASALALAMGTPICLAQFESELVINGDVESGSVFLNEVNNWGTINNTGGDWTIAFNNTPGGERSMSIPPQSGFHAWVTNEEDRPQVVPPAPDSNGGDVTFSFFYNIPDVANQVVIGATVEWRNDSGTFLGADRDLDVGGRDEIDNTVTTGGAWQQASFLLTPPTGATNANILMFTFIGDDETATGTVYFDDISMVQAQGEGACNPADVSEPFGALDAMDIMAYVDLAEDDQTLRTASDNRVGNPSFEDNFNDPLDDPDEGLEPVDWFSFNFEPNGAFYELGGDMGNPPARTGNWMIRAADDGDPGGFHGWTADGFGVSEFNLDNELVFEGWFNVPNEIDSLVVGVKLESLDIDEETGAFIGNVAPVTLAGGPGSGDVIISDGSSTDGWEQFRITYPADRLSPTRNRVRPLLFLFNPDGNAIEGEIFFDDIFIGQQDNRQADVDEDGDTDIFDLLANLEVFDAGCPGG